MFFSKKLEFLGIVFLSFTSVMLHSADIEQNAVDQVSGFRKWLSWQTASGDWHGERERLKNNGFSISMNYTTDDVANPVGGVKKSAAYAGFLNVSIALDFEKIASIKGLALTIGNYLASGKNLSKDIGNFYGVEEIYAAGNYFFGELDLSESLFNNKLIVEVGRLFAGDVFAQSELWQYYVSGGINGNFGAIGSNIFFPSFNIAAWAARLTWQPNKNWQFAAAVYNADTNVEDVHKHGLYFSFKMDNGCLAIGQLTYKHHQSQKEEGLPGSAVLGAYYQSSKFFKISDPLEYQRGNCGLYFIFDQMLFRSDWPEFVGPEHLNGGSGYAEKVKHPYHRQTVVAKDRPKGLTVWGGAYFAPQEQINTQIYQLTAGLLYQGLWPNRDRDVTAFAVILGKFSDKLASEKIETVLELNHRLQLGPWFYITPDIQYVIRPNGIKNIPNALVLGLEASVNF